MNKTAIILGSTGLTGSLLLQILLDSEVYNEVISFVRKKTEVSHKKLIEHIVDFDNPDSFQNLVVGNDLFCCLGTTIKKAGSQEAFEKVDLHYPVMFAKIAAKNGIEQYLIISAIGADAESSNFYMRTKGKCENALNVIGFRSLSIFQPSLLLGDRKEFRLGEKLGIYIMKVVSFFLFGGLKKYKAIQASKVASAMYKVAQQNNKGMHIYTSDIIQSL